MRLRAAALTAACLAVVIGGCGGGEAGGERSWSEQADAICAGTQARIRGREPARSSADLERLMTAVVDDLAAGRADLRQLEIPEGRRAAARRFLRDVDRVLAAAKKVRDAGSDHVKVWMTAYDARITALDLEEHARAAGLRKCGRDASTKGVDAVMMPGYARDVAELAAVLIAQIEAAEKLPRPGRSRAYWSAVYGVTQTRGTGREPESLSDLETDFTGPLSEAEYDVRDVLSHYDGSYRLPSSELREKERRLHEVMRSAPAKGYALLAATGPPGKALVPDVKRAVRKTVKRAEG